MHKVKDTIIVLAKIRFFMYYLLSDAGTTKSSSADDAASDSGTAKSAK